MEPESRIKPDFSYSIITVDFVDRCWNDVRKADLWQIQPRYDIIDRFF